MTDVMVKVMNDIAMEIYMKVNFKEAKQMGMAYIIGKMEKFMKVNG